jgi:hypothetical protein
MSVEQWGMLELQANTTDPINKQAAKILIEFLVPILAPSIAALSQIRGTGKVSFGTV